VEITSEKKEEEAGGGGAGKKGKTLGDGMYPNFWPWIQRLYGLKEI
jgi:hypothetical protein